jgi:hypothetical protein
MRLRSIENAVGNVINRVSDLERKRAARFEFRPWRW